MEWKVAPSYEKWDIININEETHKATIKTKCWKCGGSGQYAWFGVCFACGGFGYEQKEVKAYTVEEYIKYIAAQAKVKEKKQETEKIRQQNLINNSEKNKKELLVKWGYDPENPLIWLIGGGDTYTIKNQLKEQGCKFSQQLGWYSCKQLDLPIGYSMVSINFNDVFTWFPMTKRFEIKENAKEIADAALSTLYPKSNSEYIGNLKERIRDLEVVLTSIRDIDNRYGTSTIYTFKYNENVLVWITSSCKDIQIGEHVLLTGTIKEYKEYKGTKQTILSRCIIKKGE